MKKSSALFILAIIVLVFAACSVEPPKATVEKVRLINATLEKVETEISILVDNPNSFAISIAEIRYTLYAGKEKIITDRMERKIELPAKGKTTVKLPVTFNAIAAAGVGLEAFSKHKINYRVEAEIDVKTKVGKITVPVSESGTLHF